jgi:hypothetical protein
MQFLSSSLLLQNRHLWADCVENVEASMSHNPMGLRGILQE